MKSEALTLLLIISWIPPCLAADPERATPKRIKNSVDIVLVAVPAGEFLMGSPESERGRGHDEPQHRVRITRPFYIGVYEVTQSQFLRVMGGDASSYSPRGRNRELVAKLNTDDFPAENVKWDDAIEFCVKLNGMPEEKAAGRSYRLPTEAEWEYACRAETITPFHYRDGLSTDLANCVSGHPYPPELNEKAPFLGRTTTAGSYQPNPFGLYDLHGNVAELCSDWYAEDYYSKSPVDDPPGPAIGTHRVLRGGRFEDFPISCRSAARSRANPRGRGIHGFRVVCQVAPKASAQ